MHYLQKRIYVKHNSILLGSFFVLSSGAWYWHVSVPTELKGQMQICVVDFDSSMCVKEFEKIFTKQGDNQILYGFFKNLYEKYSPAQVKATQYAKIPKIIHHIWMGSKMRMEDEPLYQSWRTYHPDWTFIFWTDNRFNYNKGDTVVHSFAQLNDVLEKDKNQPKLIVVDITHLQFDNRIYFDRAINYGERSDILRYEIVNKIGGLYVDCDFECYKSHEILHYVYDFYTGIQPLDTNSVQLGSALFGAIAKHPILETCVQNIKNMQHIQQIIVKTGPLYFTKIFYMVAGKKGYKDIAFPASYFYPQGYEQQFEPKEKWCQNESFATHHWAGSWLKPEGFVKKII